jgi:hypothetical protein
MGPEDTINDNWCLTGRSRRAARYANQLRQQVDSLIVKMTSKHPESSVNEWHQPPSARPVGIVLGAELRL